MVPTGAEGGGGGPFMGRRRSKRCLLHVGTSCKLAAIHDVCLAGAWQIGGSDKDWEYVASRVIPIWAGSKL